MHTEHVLTIAGKLYLKMQFSAQTRVSLLEHGFTNCFGVLSPLDQGGGWKHFLIISPQTTRRYVADLMLPRTNALSTDALDSYSGWRITTEPRVILFLISSCRRKRVSWLQSHPIHLFFPKSIPTLYNPQLTRHRKMTNKQPWPPKYAF